MRTYAYITIIFNSGMDQKIKLDITQETNTPTAGKTLESRNKLDRLLHTQAPITFDMLETYLDSLGNTTKRTMTIQRNCIAVIDVQYVEYEEDDTNVVRPDTVVS